jgi:hypothetical protein
MLPLLQRQYCKVESDHIMGISVRIIDEQFGKTKTPIFDILYPTESVTVRDFITRRVEEEVAQVNSMKRDPDRIDEQHRMFLAGLTKMSPEVLLNKKSQRRSRRMVDVKHAIDTALKAFMKGDFFLLYDNKQVEDLNETLLLKPDSEAVFLRLTPLIGG